MEIDKEKYPEDYNAYKTYIKCFGIVIIMLGLSFMIESITPLLDIIISYGIISLIINGFKLVFNTEKILNKMK